MLNNKCASTALVVATAAGALLTGAPAYAQSDLAQYWHHRHRFGFFHRHHHANLNHNRPRVFIRIYIYNKNNNLAIAGQRQREQQQQRQEDLGGSRERRGVDLAPVGPRADRLTPTDTGGDRAAPAYRPSAVHDQQATRPEQPVARSDRPAQDQAVTHSEPGVVRHDPGNGQGTAPSEVGAP